MELAQKGAISGVRWVQWFFSVGKRVDHAALAAAAAALILLRSPAAQHLARQQSKLGRTFRTLHLFVPRFPLFFVLAILFLWRSWRERRACDGQPSCVSSWRHVTYRGRPRTAGTPRRRRRARPWGSPRPPR